VPAVNLSEFCLETCDGLNHVHVRRHQFNHHKPPAVPNRG
jgi:hypothetical protein